MSLTTTLNHSDILGARIRREFGTDKCTITFVCSYIGQEVEIAVLDIEPTYFDELQIMPYQDRSMVLLQMIMTPHMHNALLGAILPYVEKRVEAEDLQEKAGLQSWVVQAKQLLNPPE